MEKDKYICKFQDVINNCQKELLEILKENKVEKIDFEECEENGGEIKPCGVFSEDVSTEVLLINSIVRCDDEEDYDQYRVEADDDYVGFISNSFIEGIRTDVLPDIYCSVVDAIEHGWFTKSEE